MALYRHRLASFLKGLQLHHHHNHCHSISRDGRFRNGEEDCANEQKEYIRQNFSFEFTNLSLQFMNRHRWHWQWEI